MRHLNIVAIEGGLGNQMFQYAFYLSLRLKIRPNDNNILYIAPIIQHNGYELKRVFNIKHKIATNCVIGLLKKYFRSAIYKIQEKPGNLFDNANFAKDKSICYFCGYWQTEIYFSQIKSHITSTFQFQQNLISLRNKELMKEIKIKDSISIHIRRGDYESNLGAKAVLGDICGLNYYEKAINYINAQIENPFYLLFSDDPEWVRQNFSFLRNSLVVDWNIKNNSWQDMMLMSYCKHNIIANSSFSWWGAWLNNNPIKMVIAPSKWFNTLEDPNIVPKNWIRL